MVVRDQDRALAFYIPETAHDLVATVAPVWLPTHLRDAIERRALTLRHRALEYARWHKTVTLDNAQHAARSRAIGIDRSIGDGLAL
jgi:hypothetical protein